MIINNIVNQENLNHGVWNIVISNKDELLLNSDDFKFPYILKNN